MKRNFKFLISFDLEAPATEWIKQVVEKMEKLGFDVSQPAVYEETFIAIHKNNK